MRSTLLLPLLLALPAARPVVAQRLLWEHPVAFTTSMTQAVFATFVNPNQTIALNYSYQVPRPVGAPCSPSYRTFYRTYDLTGTLLRERQGRNAATSDGGYIAVPAGGSGSWWAGHGSVCSGPVEYARPYLQRLSARGDTLRGFWLAPSPPGAYASAVVAAGNRLVTAGHVRPTGQPLRFQLTCTDTAGTIRWQYNYPRPNNASNDYCSAMVRTPRGGYLLSGDGQVGLGFQHYLLETDSLGRQLKQLIFSPLGPGFTGGIRHSTFSNILTLPNAQGYLLSGTGDSSMGQKTIGYVMRLDTALNVQWVYRNPPRTNGNNNRSQRAWKIRMLSNSVVGVVLNDSRNTGTPDTYLVAVDIATGQRVGSPFILMSNTQFSLLPYEWQWLGDGTLLLAGKSLEVGVTGQQGYLARWDFRGTPLATRTTAETTEIATTFTLSPNPATGPLTLTWQLPPAARAGQLRLYSPLGQLLKTLPLPPTASGRLEVAGLPPGLYLARLLDAAGAGQGRAQRLLVRE